MASVFAMSLVCTNACFLDKVKRPFVIIATPVSAKRSHIDHHKRPQPGPKKADNMRPQRHTSTHQACTHVAIKRGGYSAQQKCSKCSEAHRGMVRCVPVAHPSALRLDARRTATSLSLVGCLVFTAKVLCSIHYFVVVFTRQPGQCSRRHLRHTMRIYIYI